jgi:hypothetical protein
MPNPSNSDGKTRTSLTLISFNISSWEVMEYNYLYQFYI